jgi:hypothetical protein
VTAGDLMLANWNVKSEIYHLSSSRIAAQETTSFSYDFIHLKRIISITNSQ